MKQFLITLSAFLLVLAPVFSQDATDLDALKNQLTAGIDLPESLQNVTLPTADDAKKLFREKCIKVSGSDASYEEAEQATTHMMECITSLVNVTALQDEIEKARPTGDLDTVFNKYCRKRSIAMECVNNFTKSIEPCLEEEEKKHKTVFINIIENLLNFVCHKDGDQIALFIAEKGPECFSENKDAIMDCMNSTFSGYVPTETPTLASLPNFILGEKECADMTKLEHCIVNELETCEESTPANLVESLFKFVKNETPCVNFTKTASPKTDHHIKPNSGQANKFSMNILMGTFMMVLLVKMIAH